MRPSGSLDRPPSNVAFAPRPTLDGPVIDAVGRLLVTVMVTASSAARPRLSVARIRTVRTPAWPKLNVTELARLSHDPSPSTSQLWSVTDTGEAESSARHFTDRPASTVALSQLIRLAGNGLSATCSATCVSVTLPASSVTRSPGL